MKKNMLSVLVLVLCVVNLTLCAYMVFTVVPNAKRTDELMTKILQIIDLELESPIPQEVVDNSYSIDDIEKYVVAVVNSNTDAITCNLKTGDDGKSHYAKVGASLTINTKDEDYARLNPKVDEMKSDIVSIIISEVSSFSYEELSDTETKAAVKKQILEAVQTMFESKFIVDVTVDWLIQ